MRVTPEDIKNSRRECSEFYSRVVSAKVSFLITSFCINSKIKANSVTHMMLIVGILSSIMILSESYIIQILGAMSLMLINLLDTVDGEIARYTKTTSKLGAYLDVVYQISIDLLLFIIIGIKLYIDSNNILFILPIAIYIFFLMVDAFSRETFVSLMVDSAENKKTENLKVSYDRNNILHYIVHVTSSNTAFYHLFWIFLIFDIFFFNTPILEVSFIIYLAFMQFVKFVGRQVKIIGILV